MARQFSILIVEDEALIALDLAAAAQDAGAVVVGPVASIVEALALLDAAKIDAAILDANLADRDITPVALELIGRAVPFVIQTGSGVPEALMQSPAIL